MSNFKLTLVTLALLAACTAPAATNFVILGDDFQTKIDAAAPSDTLVVQAGVYPGNLNFNKALTVLRSGTNQIQLLGTVQITGAGNSSFQFSQFASAVTIQATGTVSFAQTEFLAPVTALAANILLSHVTSAHSFTANLSTTMGTNLQAFDTTFNTFNSFGLSVTGGKALIKRCVVFGLTLAGNASLEALRMTNYYSANDGAQPAAVATATIESGAKFVAVQSTFLSSLFLSGYKVWLGYDSISGQLQQTNCGSVLVGNYFSSVYPGYNLFGAMVTASGGTLKAYNNLLYANANMIAGFKVNGAVSEIVNNTIYMNSPDGGSLYGISVTNGGVSPIIRGNVIYMTKTYCCPLPTPSYGIVGDGQPLNVSYCCVFQGSGVIGQPFFNTGPSINSFVADPVFAGSYTLHPSSPCINAGPPEAIYNDRDGSRNDMGYTGGPYWNPANYTNDNPMVFFLTGSPQTVLKGVQTNITVNAAASAGH